MNRSAETKERTVVPIMQNRKARHDYEVVETIEAGIALVGTEVKSVRAKRCNLQDGYALFEGKENPQLLLKGLHISSYDQGTTNPHDPLRVRKLLLKRRELDRLYRKVQEKGLTLVPLDIYLSGPYVKIKLGLVRGKKQYDKREDLKSRDVQRDLRRFRA